MNEELVSIIVPVYNVEKYLPRCVESLMRQTYKKIEIILVDDGSKDSSGDICDKYAEEDKRIRVIHQENSGVSVARNAGLDRVTGQYLTFVDADDYVSDDYVKALFDIIKKAQADVSLCQEKKFYCEEELQEEVRSDEVKAFTNEEALKSMLYRKEINSYVWGKLYKSELFENIRFPVGRIFEDVFIMYRVYDRTNKVAYCPIKLYYYYQRSDSIVHSSFSKVKMDQVLASEEILEFMRKKYPRNEKAAVSKCFVAAVDLYRRMPEDEFNEERNHLIEVIKKNRKIVLLDKENKLLTRIIAIVAFINVRSLRVAGKIYQILVEKRVIHLKTPI